MSKKQEGSVLGIELQDSEIRITEVRVKGGKPSITNVGYGPMPLGVMHRGVVSEPVILAASIRSILQKMGVNGSSRAVLGVPSEGTIVTSISIPPAPQSEVSNLVRGELNHYSILRTHGSAYSYMQLHPPTRGAEAEQMQLAVLGAESDVIHGLTQTAEAAGLQISALEPVQYAMFRSSFSQAGTTSTGFHVMLGPSQTDVSFVWNGNVCFYRRIDVGSRAFSDQMEQSVTTTRGEHDDYIDVSTSTVTGLQVLALEIRRAIEYLAREYPDFLVLEHLYLTLDRPESEALSEPLQEQTGMRVELVQAPAAFATTSDLKLDLANSEGTRYAGSYGLASRESILVSHAVPKIDLFFQERQAAQLEEKKRNLVGSFVVTGVAAAAGLLGWYMFGNRAEAAEAEVAKTQEQILAKQTEAVQTMKDRQRRLDQYLVLRREGLPVGAIMDYVCASLMPGVGLTDLSVGGNLQLDLAGEALSEPLITGTQRMLETSPIINGVRTQSYQRVGKTKEEGFRFKFIANTVPSDRIRYPHEKNTEDGQS